MKAKILLMGFFLVISAHATSLDDKIEAIIRATQSTSDTGVAVGIIQKGKVVLSRGYGYRDREAKLPVTEKTLFAIGSTTKAFTGVTLAIAAQDGLLDLETPIVRYLPDFAMKDPNATREITALDLMTHRSGLPRHDFVWYLTPFSRENLAYRLRYLDPNPNITFRKGFQYNNLMFMMGGYLLERLSGQTWEDYLRARVLEPLGMNDTAFSPSEAKKAAELAVPYTGKKKIPHKDLSNVGPAGSLYSNLSDMTRWLQFQIRKGKTEAGVELLPTTIFESVLWAPHIPVRLLGLNGSYGVGWFLNRLLGRQYIWHGGNIDGFSAHVSFLPEEETGIIVLMNQSGERSLMFEIQHRIYQLLLEEKADDGAIIDKLPHALPDATAAAITDTTPRFVTAGRETTDVLSVHGGIYEDAGYGELHIIEGNDKIKAYYYGTLVDLVKAEKENQYTLHLELSWVSRNIPLNFLWDKGVVHALTLPFESDAPAVTFSRLMELR